MSIASELADVLTEVESDFAETVTIGGVDYAACVSVATRRRGLEEGGFAVEDDLTVTMRTATIAAPQAQSELVHNGITYTVDRVTRLPGGTAYRLHCVAGSRGA